jgi:hypothetical protein
VGKGAIALEAVTKIIQRTPVKSGLARGNWNLSIGTPDPTRRRPSPTGKAAIERAKQVLGTNRTGVGAVRIVYIVNSLPYINRLENGWSQQAPKGMIAITLADLPGRAGQILKTQLGPQ